MKYIVIGEYTKKDGTKVVCHTYSDESTIPNFRFIARVWGPYDMSSDVPSLKSIIDQEERMEKRK